MIPGYMKSYIDTDMAMTRALYELLSSEHFESVKEEEEMVREKKFFKGQTLIRSDGSEVEFLHDDGGEFIPILMSHGDNTDWIAREDVKPSNKFTFAQVIQGLLEGYFEEGAEFKVMGMSVFADEAIFHGFGLKEEKNSDYIEMEIGANLINATWELVKPEPPAKELTLDELESLLGYKVKIKNND